ncbi:NADH-quinone oxidoreductase subunit D-related protein [Escherichia coli]
MFFAFTIVRKFTILVGKLLRVSRMHPAWFRIGGVAHDLPRGWDCLLRASPRAGCRTVSYEKAALQNTILNVVPRALPPMGAKEALERDHWRGPARYRD